MFFNSMQKTRQMGHKNGPSVFLIKIITIYYISQDHYKVSISAKTIDEVKNMKGKIAVEQNLTPVVNYLTSQGYSVVSMSATDMLNGDKNGYDALVISGASENFLGMEDRVTETNVINASGLSPEDVARRISG